MCDHALASGSTPCRAGSELLAVDRGLVDEVEGLEARDDGEAGQVGAHGHVPGGLGRHLFTEQVVEEVGEGTLGTDSVLERGFELFAILEQPEALQMLAEAFQLGHDHGRTAWPAVAIYS